MGRFLSRIGPFYRRSPGGGRGLEVVCADSVFLVLFDVTSTFLILILCVGLVSWHLSAFNAF